MVSNFIVQHNLSISAADHISQLFKNVFPDSLIASSYARAKTKIFCIINKAFQPYYHKQIIDHCKNHPFTVGHIRSNDTGVQKMNPVAVRIFDINRSKTVSEHFYIMCLLMVKMLVKHIKVLRRLIAFFSQMEYHGRTVQA